MLLAIPNVLTPAAAAKLREKILHAEWVAAGVDAGVEGGNNWQLPPDGEVTRIAQAEVTAALMDSAPFLSAALPHTVFPPLFSHYRAGDKAERQVDRAIRCDKATGARIRADLSCTIFLTDPADYDGGELEIDGRIGKASYKLPAGHMLIYPSASLHRVTPVTRGERVSSFFWLQSLVAEHSAREVLYDLDQSVQALAVERGKSDGEVLRLTAIYHNLVRRWAEA
jgi:PKHD-type hydroxylase